MTHQFTIKFTEEHVKCASRRWFVRYIGVGIPIMLLLVAIVVAQRLISGQLDWIFGAFLAVLGVWAGLFVTAYFRRLNFSKGQLRKMDDGTVQYELSDERFKTSSSLGVMEAKWEIFKGLWIFPEVWLLMFDGAGFLTLPADQLNEEVKKFLKEKIAAVGGKIK